MSRNGESVMKKILKGHIIYTLSKERFEVHENSYIVYDGELVEGVYESLPEELAQHEVTDYGDAIIIPSFIDLHIHAPQYMQIGLGLNLELIDWLDQYTFMLESRFADVEYGRKVYPHFVDALYNHGSLRSCIYGTIHDESTRYLVEALEEKGLSAYVGKVNMDRHAPDSLIQTTVKSLHETREFIEEFIDGSMVKPIITPRFAPSCTEELLMGLGELAKEYHVPVQSHLAENKSEVEWVKELFPGSKNYSDVYIGTGLYGQEKTLMAHSIFLEEEEIRMAIDSDVYLIHCPNSNLNLSSGIMPLTQFLDRGLTIGFGSDVGAGHEIGMNKTISAAIECSKVRHMMNKEERILSEPEAFYLATNVNGSFFGNVGTFKKGYKFDALIIKDTDPLMTTLTPLEQLQRFLYCGGPESILARYLEGVRI